MFLNQLNIIVESNHITVLVYYSITRTNPGVATEEDMFSSVREYLFGWFNKSIVINLSLVGLISLPKKWPRRRSVALYGYSIFRCVGESRTPPNTK